MLPIRGLKFQITASLPATTGSVTQKVVALVRRHPWVAIGLTVGALSLASAGLAACYGIIQLRKPKDIFDAIVRLLENTAEANARHEGRWSSLYPDRDSYTYWCREGTF